MDRRELVELRRDMLDLYDNRRALGEFDAHAGTILVLMDTIIRLINHEIDEAKNVHRQAQS